MKNVIYNVHLCHFVTVFKSAITFLLLTILQTVTHPIFGVHLKSGSRPMLHIPCNPFSGCHSDFASSIAINNTDQAFDPDL